VLRVNPADKHKVLRKEYRREPEGGSTRGTLASGGLGSSAIRCASAPDAAGANGAVAPEVGMRMRVVELKMSFSMSCAMNSITSVPYGYGPCSISGY